MYLPCPRAESAHDWGRHLASRGAERARAFGYLASAVGVSVAIGPVMGGLLIEFGGPELGWRLTFLVNIPVGIIAIILGLLWFPKALITLPDWLSSSSTKAAKMPSLDAIGSALLGLAVLTILFPFVESGGSTALWLLLPGGILMIYAWVKWERYYARTDRTPMVDLDIFSTRSFTNGTAIMTLYFLGMTSVWYACDAGNGDGGKEIIQRYFPLRAVSTALLALVEGICPATSRPTKPTSQTYL